jgi:hypothetical protein
MENNNQTNPAYHTYTQPYYNLPSPSLSTNSVT